MNDVQEKIPIDFVKSISIFENKTRYNSEAHC